MVDPNKTAPPDMPTARTASPMVVSAGTPAPALPDAIKAKLRAAAAETATESVASAGLVERLRVRVGRVQAALPLRAAGLREQLKGIAGARPNLASLRKLPMPQISPELRDGLVKQGRRAGLGIGTAIDKIIREVPAPVLRTQPAPDIERSDITTMAVQRAVRQPSIFAPGHILTALLTGGIIHIVTTFAITALGTGSAYRQLRSVLPANEIVVMPAQAPGTQLLPFLAPDMLYAICRFDLSGGALDVNAMLPEAGWSLALYTRQGDNFYATPGQSQRPVPVAFVLSPVSDRLVNMQPGVRKSDVDVSQVTSPDTEGLVVVRAPLKGVAFEATARADLKRANCAPSRR